MIYQWSDGVRVFEARSDDPVIKSIYHAVPNDRVEILEPLFQLFGVRVVYR